MGKLHVQKRDCYVAFASVSLQNMLTGSLLCLSVGSDTEGSASVIEDRKKTRPVLFVYNTAPFSLEKQKSCSIIFLQVIFVYKAYFSRSSDAYQPSSPPARTQSPRNRPACAES